ncbi:MAG: hypothetical protein QOH64_1710 [Acidimicrobiaceae bacterium]
MTVQDDASPTDTSRTTEGAAGFGGGLLGLVRDEVTALRTSAAVERAALIDTIATRLTDIEEQLSELRADVSSARADLEASRIAVAGSLADVHAAVAAAGAGDVGALVQQAVAAQVVPIVQAVVDAMGPQIERTGAEVAYLRTALIGPGT